MWLPFADDEVPAINSEGLLGLIAGYDDIKALADETYEARGIFNSEMAAIVCLARSLSIDTLIETGRARGQSTYILGKYLPDTRIISIELLRDADALFAEERLSLFRNIELIYGDAFELLPNLIRDDPSKRKAVLIDGPKYRQALQLLWSCFKLSENVRIGFIHDLSKDRDARYEVPEFFTNYYFTDNHKYVERLGYLDRNVFGSNSNRKAPFHSRGKVRKSYGPTLGIFTPSPSDIDKVQRGQLGRKMRKALRILLKKPAPGVDF